MRLRENFGSNRWDVSMSYFMLLLFLVAGAASRSPCMAEAHANQRLPAGVPPVLACWFWHEPEFEPGGYRPFVDLMARHSAANMLTTSLRAPNREVTDPAVAAQIAEAARYARAQGLGVVMDLDVRLAREAFRAAHPDELQEMLRLREVPLEAAGEVAFSIQSEDLNDHYTARTTHYIALSGRLVRVYDYVRTKAGIDPATIREITDSCRVMEAGAAAVRVAIPCNAESNGRTACVITSFTHLTPDVFAPHLLEFQRGVLARYAEAGLAGACKDEWGFPPSFDGCPAKDDYWFSSARAEAYAAQTGGRDLVRDCVSMTYGEVGGERARQASINTFLKMSTERNGAIESDFYRAVKELLGKDALVATHPTWYPYPGRREFKKNGLHWWIAQRDLAQTDEVTPYAVRTSLAKKWNSPIWMNMFYASNPADYRTALWAHALGGGRINYHPVYPTPPHWPRFAREMALLNDGLMRDDCRVRLLNFITRTPLDCPVAIVFGHACAMNWAGPHYDDVGMGLADAFWRAGYPADLIPSSEITHGALRIGDDGRIAYGPQRYHAAVLYHPEFEPVTTASFFQSAANGGTRLYRSGDWTRGPDAEDFDGVASLPGAMETLTDPQAVIAHLEAAGATRQSPALNAMKAFDRESAAPGAAGRCRLIDGTTILAAGEQDPAGDPIETSFELDGHRVSVKAVGVVGVRLSASGELDALAAGGLSEFAAGPTRIDLRAPCDLAFWHEPDGTARGVVQAWDGPIPAPLRALTENWLRLDVPEPLDWTAPDPGVTK